MPDVNALDEMAAGKPCDEVLRSLAAMSDEDLKHAALRVSDDQIPWMLSFVERVFGATEVKKTLMCGALLHAVSFIENTAERRELVSALYEQMGLSRTQGYRCIQVWKVFGTQLLAEPCLMDQFCAEALKALAEERTPCSAREEAVQLARRGARLSIKQAETLQARHARPVETSNSSDRVLKKSARKSSRPSESAGLFRKWTFSGAVVRVELKPTQPLEPKDLQDVISDLQAALSELQALAERTLINELVLI